MAKLDGSAVGRIAMWFSITLLLASVVQSCAESTSPPVVGSTMGRRPAAKRVAKEMLSLPPSEVSLPAAGSSIVNIADYSAYPEGVIVDISIAGNISFSSHSLAFPINYSGALDYLGVRVENQSDCYLNAKVEFSQISGASNPFPNSVACLIPRVMSNYSTRAKVGGVGRALRGLMPLGNGYPVIRLGRLATSAT